MMDLSVSEVISMCALILTCVVAAISIILTAEQIKKNRYSRYISERKEVSIDEYRRYFEDKISELQYELAKNERRWKDVNHLIINAQNSNSSVHYEDNSNSSFSPKFF